MADKSINIGLFGFGCVGQGLWNALKQSKNSDIRIRKICIRDAQKERELDKSYFTTDAEELLNDSKINTIVELIDDPVAAFRIVKKALEKGKAVVSANKKMIAENFTELLALQEKYKTPFLYEGACCASIPVVRNLEEYYDNDFLSGIEGIFNGSTNYILSRVFEDGLEFSGALELAQENGFAETDPSLDVNGHDPAFKLSILIAHAFGEIYPASCILRQGIGGLSQAEIRFARERGWKLKLVASARKVEGKLFASVLPGFVRQENALFDVRDEYNAVIVEGAFSEQQLLKGKGAGSLPTGGAVLSDISALRYNYRYGYRKLRRGNLSDGKNDFVLPIYFRYNDPETLVKLNFERMDENFRTNEYGWQTGLVKVSQLREFLNGTDPERFFIAVLPDGRPEVPEKPRQKYVMAIF